MQTTATVRPVALDRGLAGRVLDHGYALTIHKAQGLTVERALLWADPGLYREAAYVGLARAREATHVYVPPTFDPIDDRDCGAPGRSQDRSGAVTLRLGQTPQLSPLVANGSSCDCCSCLARNPQV